MRFKGSMERFKKRLFRINDDEPLSKLSLTVILFLDFFVLSILFNGLQDHTNQLTRSYDYIPSMCRNILIDNDYSKDERLDLLQDMVLQDHGNYSYRYQSPFAAARMEQMHESCQELYRGIQNVSAVTAVKDLFEQRKDAQSAIEKHKRSLKKFTSAYDTALLEKIASQKDSRLPAIKRSIHQHTQEIEDLQQKIVSLGKKLDQAADIEQVSQKYFVTGHPFKQKLIKALADYEFWYPFKRFVWEMLYLLPIFALFLWWNHYSVTKLYTLQILVTSHLLVVSAFPIFLKILDLVLELIPKHFFKQLFELLERFNLIALWHYLVILFVVSFALFIIYIIQKKLFNKARLYEHRLMKGACFHCGKRLPHGAVACPFCGTKQFETCQVCGKERLIGTSYCSQCGEMDQSSENAKQG